MSAAQAAQTGLITGFTGVVGATAAHVAFCNPALTATASAVGALYVITSRPEAVDATRELVGRASGVVSDEIKAHGKWLGHLVILGGGVAGFATGILAFPFVCGTIGVGIVVSEGILTYK